MPTNQPDAPNESPNATAQNSAPSNTTRARRRFITRRNAVIAVLGSVALFLLVLIIALIFIRTGRLDHIVANQIKDTLATFGVRTEIDDFHIAFSPRTVEMRGVKLYDAQTGGQIARVERLIAVVRVEDLFALNLRRNVNLEKLQIDNLEAWVAFDAQGYSNFHNLHLPPPDPNRRILFSYSTAQVTINNALVHYGDELHKLSGEARNVNAQIQPDDPNAPAESAMNRVALTLSNSTFAFDDSQINNIAIDASGRINETRAEIQELNLHSPLTETQLTGVLDDWRAFRYHMNVTSSVDLTQAADLLSAGSDLRGSGKFVGTVEGEGAKYKVNGQIHSDALAAYGVRLQGLNFNGGGQGESTSYEAQGRAVADLLQSGDFKINSLQLAGKVTGTGTDFRWIGDLRAAALRQGNFTISGLIANDTLAEARDQLQRISGTVKNINARNLIVAGATKAQASNLNIAGVNFAREANGSLRLSAPHVRAGSINAAGAKIGGVDASGVMVMSADGRTTRVNVKDVRVASLAAAGVQTNGLNIAGVRLSIANNGRIEGATNDVNVGAAALNLNGQTGNVKDVGVAHPVFIVEPNGNYRASADLSLGGGVLGSVELGKAQSKVVVTNGALALNDLNAEVMKGAARGQAVIAFARNASSRVQLNFDNLDLSKLVSLTGRSIPLAATTNGNVDLTFPSTNFALASGIINAQFNGTTGNANTTNTNDASVTAQSPSDNGRTPLTGEVALRAERGTFQIERARLQTSASELTATGQFSLANDSNLQINLASTDAGELERVIASTGLAPSFESTLALVDLAGGKLSFNGTVRGRLTEPNLDGRLSLDPLIINKRDLGALTASINASPAFLRIEQGRLTQRDGGNAQFSANIPFDGTNTGTIDATLDRVNIGNLANAVGTNNSSKSVGGVKLDDFGAISGRVQVAGVPNNLSGNADVKIGAGSINGVAFNQINARATFDGRLIKLDDLEAQLNPGKINVNGTVALGQVFGKTVPTSLDIHARGENVNLALVNAVAGSNKLPQLSGTADFTADISTPMQRNNAYEIALNAQGRDVKVNGRDAGALTLVGRTENQKFNFQLTTGLLGQPQTITAQVDLSKSALPATISTTLTNADLTPLFNVLLTQYAPGANVRVTGRANGTISASGNLNENGYSLAALKGRAEFSELNLQIEDVSLSAAAPLVVNFSPDEINFERARLVGAGTNIALNGAIALSPRGTQNFSADGDLNLRVLDAFNPNVFFGGTSRFQLRVAGAYNEPRVTGTASVNGASFSTLLSNGRLTFNNINGLIRFTDNRAEVSNLTGMLGGGRVTVGGGAVLSGFVPTQFRFTLRGDNVSAPLPHDVRGTGDVELVFQGSQQTQFLTGTISLKRAEYTENIDLADLVSRRTEGSLATGGTSSFLSNVQLDLKVSGRDALVIRNNLADAVGSASLQIRGTVDEPLIAGRFTTTRGTVMFRNERYEITRAFVDLNPDGDPIINFQGESEIKGYRVIVSLNGPLSQLQASVRSDPALPQADVVALITTGDLSPNTENGSAFSQAGLGTATGLIADALINAPIQRATDRLFGLNRFQIDPLVGGDSRSGASPTARLTIGRQINRNLSVTYSTNVTSDQNQIVAVEYRVSDRLSFVAQYEQRSSSGLRSQNNNFNFEIRFRKRF